MKARAITTAAGCVLGLAVSSVLADTFGSGDNAFTIDFVTIGRPGNADDPGIGSYFSPYGGVAYTFRMAVTEITKDSITKATNLGLNDVTAGAWNGSQPAADITWYEAAAFVNWLNTSTGHQAAYRLDLRGSGALTRWSSATAWDDDPGVGVALNRYRHKDAYYFLPSDDEWYKAAYHKNDGYPGNSAHYWMYAVQNDRIPEAVASGTAAGTAVYGRAGGVPANVDNSGGLSAYGTRGQNGRVCRPSDVGTINKATNYICTFGPRTCTTSAWNRKSNPTRTAL